MNSNQVKGFPQVPEKPAMLGFEAFKQLVGEAFGKSGIHPDLIPDTFQAETSSENGDHELTGLKARLGWTSLEDEIKKSRWSQDIIAYWFVNEDGSDWQSILNIPEIKDGVVKRPYRYIAPKKETNKKGENDLPFFPPVPYPIRKLISSRFNVPIGGETDGVPNIPSDGVPFWPWWSEYGHLRLPLVVTEGGKKALSLLSQGIPAIALYGCRCGFEYDKETTVTSLRERLKTFCKPHGRVIVAHDNDALGNYKETESGKLALIRALKNEGCKPVSRFTWAADYKGVDDLIVGNPTHFESRFEKALYPEALGKVSSLREQLLTRFGSRLQWNQLKKRIELDKVPLKTDNIGDWWDEYFPGYTPEMVHLKQAVSAHAFKFQYHPVKDWLLSLSHQSNLELPIVNIDKIATTYLKTDNPFYDVLLRKTLLSAVARALDPGCQVDTVCCLQGSQGLRKNRFWQSLSFADRDWYGNNFNGCNKGKDEYIKIGTYWFIDMDEIDATISSKDISALKSSITCRVDGYRPPYGTKEESFPRHSIFVGSFNIPDMLRDSENRRFWIVPVTQKITLPSEQEVTAIWKAVVERYLSNPKEEYLWWLDEEEEQLQKLLNKQYEKNDVYSDVIADNLDLLEKKPHTTSEIALNILGFDAVARISRKDSDRISHCMRVMGFELIRGTKVPYRDKKIWVLANKLVPKLVPTPNPDGEPVSEKTQKLVPKLVPTQNPDGEPITAKMGTSLLKNQRSKELSTKNENECLQKHTDNEYVQTPKTENCTDFLMFQNFNLTSTQNPKNGSQSRLEVGTSQNGELVPKNPKTSSQSRLEVGTSMGTSLGTSLGTSTQTVKIDWYGSLVTAQWNQLTGVGSDGKKACRDLIKKLPPDVAKNLVMEATLIPLWDYAS